MSVTNVRIKRRVFLGLMKLNFRSSMSISSHLNSSFVCYAQIVLASTSLSQVMGYTNRLTLERVSGVQVSMRSFSVTQVGNASSYILNVKSSCLELRSGSSSSTTGRTLRKKRFKDSRKRGFGLSSLRIAAVDRTASSLSNVNDRYIPSRFGHYLPYCLSFN